MSNNPYDLHGVECVKKTYACTVNVLGPRGRFSRKKSGPRFPLSAEADKIVAYILALWRDLTLACMSGLLSPRG